MRQNLQHVLFLVAATLSGCTRGADVSCGEGTVLEGNLCVSALSGAPDGGTGVGGVSGSDMGATAPDMAVAPLPGVSVLTQHNDLARTGANLQETLLTTSNVNAQDFGKLYCLPVDDQIYAQPLLVHALVVGGVMRDVLFVATVNDTVYAFDATDPFADPLWRKSLLPAGAVPARNTDMTGACGGHYTDFSGNMGIVGTPVIDPASGTLYVVARTKEGGAFAQRLHALDIHTGAERPASPVSITASVTGSGEGASDGKIAFDPLRENQRSGLLLSKGVVYITWAGECDWPPYHGWVIGYDAATLAQAFVYNDTPGGGDGGIWGSGGAPAADAQGNIYVATGNGTVGVPGNPSDLSNRGESFLKLSPSGTSLNIASWFTPYDYAAADTSDIDFGTTGVLLIPGTSLAVAGAKNSVLYIVNRDNMGGVSAVAGDPQIVQRIDLGAAGIYGTPAFWSSPKGSMMYTWPSGGALMEYLLDSTSGTFGAQPDATHAENPIPQLSVALSLSANGSTPGSGILWASHAIANPNQTVRPGVLRAFDAANVANELWNSSLEPDRDSPGTFAKFAAPTIANGHVYLPTFSNQVCVYGLLGAPNPPTQLNAVATSTNGVNLTWKDNSNGKASFSIERSSDGSTFAAIGSAVEGSISFGDISTLIPYATYYYRVRALRGTLSSTYSSVVHVALTAGPPAPSLLASGNGQAIPAGAKVPMTTNLTEFEPDTAGAKVTHTFVLTNRGALPLTFDGSPVLGAGASGFSIDQAPTGPLAVGASALLIVSFTPPANGDVFTTVLISSNDPTTPAYTFAIAGSGVSSLVGWWQLDDGSGTSALDSSGDGANGTFVGSPTWTTGQFGGAVALSGQSAIQVPSVSGLNPTNAITIAAWINPSTPFSAATNPRVLQKGLNDNQYRLLVEFGSLKFELANVGSAASTTLPPANIWTHVAGTYDGTSVTLWVNGQPLAVVAASGPLSVTGDPVLIGTKAATASAGDFFQGMMDDVRVYSRALSAAEIQALASVGTTVHFSADVQPIFDAHCTSCHDSGSPTLTASMSWASIVGVASGEQSAFPFVQPGDVDHSYLYAKIAGGTPNITITGSLMPRGASMLTQADLDTIAQWIAQGAPNN